jgi:phosphohistidine phosphatase
MRRLMVLRHAKSEWQGGESDHERTINEHGRRCAALIGAHVTQADLVPELALCSSAIRARSTLDLAIEAGDWSTTVDETDALYDATVSGVMAVIAEAPGVTTLMVVGHEPTWSKMVGVLTGDTVPMKTATLVVLELDRDSWTEIEPNSCRVISVTHAHQLRAG